MNKLLSAFCSKTCMTEPLYGDPCAVCRKIAMVCNGAACLQNEHGYHRHGAFRFTVSLICKRPIASLCLMMIQINNGETG
jgi:hypothetical protein